MKKRNVSSIVTPKAHVPFNPTTTPNDDAKERRLRRKSAMDRRRSELATPKPRELAASLKALNQVEDGFFGDLEITGSAEKAKANLPHLSSEELNRRFEEWMKIAADNKINMHNTWDFALIDYFYDMRLLKDGGTINFQKASCTLDGCVKIYSSRVDSVATETGKLLTGLTDAPGAKEGQNDDHSQENANIRKSRKKGANTTNTLADSDTLNLKKFDLELAADPLFRKACAEFDEGGASGLLLNSLNVDNTGRLLFDAGSEIGFINNSQDNKKDSITETDLVLDNNNNLDSNILEILADINNKMEDKVIVPLLRDYVLEKDESDDVNNIDDFLNFGENCEQNEDFNIDNDLNSSANNGNYAQDQQKITENSAPAFDFNSSDAFFSYFDTNSKKNWAGPEHWKVAFPKNIGNKNFNTVESNNAQIKTSKVKKEKEPFIIDFNNNELMDTKKIFLQPTKLSQLRLPKSATNSKNKHLLPADMQFNSKKIFSLFLKPTLQFKAMNNKASQNASQKSSISTNPTQEGIFTVEGEENFNSFSGYDDDGDDFDQLHQDLDSSNIQSNNDVDSNEISNLSMVETLLNNGSVLLGDSLPALKVIKPLYLQYAKVPKKVDVKRLKDNIWRGISEPKNEDLLEKCDNEDRSIEKIQKANEFENNIISQPGEHKFSDVLGELKKSYTTDKLADISVPFCFICLLHLANEKNLEIQSSQDTSELIIYNPSA
ncbi:hypothetical protein BB561_000483 [Smittium simulii]|uniref:Condensin complex subunit 2 n=1 Tax=Smittium simulii TaxID=133385 RepID=A0A2T9YYY3_9FUNG|nr:hypothetical protein BB561_000483 [Smittium simulii]